MSADMQDHDYWTFFSAEAKKIGSPLYGELAARIRTDKKLRAIAANAKPGQPQANLILAAVHYLMLDGRQHPLSKHYPSLSAEPLPPEGAFEQFQEFCAQHESEVQSLVSWRITNTNEVARSTTLYPAFDFIAQATGSPLHMIEIGPSAGFNINWNHYEYSYAQEGAQPLHRTPPGALLKLSAELRGKKKPSLSQVFPQVQSKLGLELNPVDLSNREDRLWLKALIFPELLPRISRLEGAINTAMSYPPPIQFGDALGLLGPALDELPAGGTPIVYHSFVTYQFSSAMRSQLEQILLNKSKLRRLFRVSVEWELNEHPVTIYRYENGRCGKVVLADCNPHGAWLEWRHEGMDLPELQ